MQMRRWLQHLNETEAPICRDAAEPYAGSALARLR